ncbi:phage integrase family protein [Desulforamulus reducens MI-1]|uniref:Phage integrase family protein n=1 Tax=Desulforamulus reducens (strain ATCC BAA-1160 / DSM 100696 / MI-1) TaxID=349161 RepID=A4J884_DESRM|nr:site-specific integrase [Desulforamulus reducens]ABO51287.1 phage integrase family protein [Desulforamulus reducens MI-1]
MAQIKLLKTGVYNITVYLGKDNQGKKVTKSKVFHGKKREAEQFAKIFETKLRKSLQPGSQMLVSDYLDYWLKRIQPSIEERTFKTYSWHLKRLKETLGDIELGELKVLLVQERLNELKDISETSVRKITTTFRTALRQAVVWELLEKDPTVGLRLPRNPKKEKKVLSSDELIKFLNAAKEYKYYLVLRILAVTGMRLGECLGLMWKDLNFDKGTMKILRSADSKTRKVLDKPKNDSSRRTVTIDKETVELLKTHRKKQAKRKVTSIRIEDELVFHVNGRPITHKAIDRTIKTALKKAELPMIRIHDLRHTAGSILLDAGYSLPTVSSLLGHSTPATTAAIYSHAIRRDINVTDALSHSEIQSEKNIK